MPRKPDGETPMFTANFRCERSLWEEFMAATRAADTTASQVLRRYMREYLRRQQARAPGAPAPLAQAQAIARPAAQADRRTAPLFDDTARAVDSVPVHSRPKGGHGRPVDGR